jgi:hypothetical protein
LLSKRMLNRKEPYYFIDLYGRGQYMGVEDDHIPFLREGKMSLFKYGILNLKNEPFKTPF